MEFFVSILPELVIALVSGVVGFFYQSYRRRARPHAVLQSWGNAFAHASVVDVEDLVVNRLTESWYIHRLAATSPLSEVNRAADDAKTLLNMGPEVLSLLDYATGLLDTADSPQSVLSAAGQPMAANFFEHLLMVLLLSNEVKVQDWAPSDAKHLESYEWEERNGSYILPLPGKNLIFGKDLNIPLIKAKLAPFVGLLEGANRGGLLECYSAVRERLSSELHIAESVSPRLADLENQFAKWSGWIFLANYGLTGMFIESTAVIALSANVRETRSTQRIRVGRRQRKRTCWDCEREWKRMVVPLESGRPSEARQLLRTRR